MKTKLDGSHPDSAVDDKGGASAPRVDAGRRRMIAAAILALAAGPLAAAPSRPAIEVWKGPECGCCKDWVKHLEAHGFRVQTHDDGNTEARQRFGIPLKYGACHTARVGGYAIEGHVPAREILRLLSEKPDAIGLAVPAMPRGAPGMDGPEYAGKRDPYQVLLLRRDGSASVYRAYAMEGAGE